MLLSCRRTSCLWHFFTSFLSTILSLKIPSSPSCWSSYTAVELFTLPLRRRTIISLSIQQQHGRRTYVLAHSIPPPSLFLPQSPHTPSEPLVLVRRRPLSGLRIRAPLPNRRSHTPGLTSNRWQSTNTARHGWPSCCPTSALCSTTLRRPPATRSTWTTTTPRAGRRSGNSPWTASTSSTARPTSRCRAPRAGPRSKPRLN